MRIGDKVVAKEVITEGGSNTPDPKARYPDYDYIHAEKGDVGIVEYIDDSTIDHFGVALPTVRFEKTGTATIVHLDEIKVKVVK